jgi:hypothetical protein
MERSVGCVEMNALIPGRQCARFDDIKLAPSGAQVSMRRADTVGAPGRLRTVLTAEADIYNIILITGYGCGHRENAEDPPSLLIERILIIHRVQQGNQPLELVGIRSGREPWVSLTFAVAVSPGIYKPKQYDQQEVAWPIGKINACENGNYGLEFGSTLDLEACKMVRTPAPPQHETETKLAAAAKMRNSVVCKLFNHNNQQAHRTRWPTKSHSVFRLRIYKGDFKLQPQRLASAEELPPAAACSL